MTKKRVKVSGKGGRVSPMSRLKNYALARGVKVTAALGLNDGNLFDARHIVDEFVEMVAGLPVDVPAAADTVVSPELRLAVVLQWRRRLR